MGIAIGDDHVALAEAAARFLADRCPPEVVRAAVDAEPEERPPFWSELASLGWLGLHIGEEYGGQGFGLSELAIVTEALGRAMAPGPFLPTVLAAALIERGGTEETKARLLPRLVSGELVGAVAFMPGVPVLSGGLADLLVAPVVVDGQERWSVFEASEFRAIAVGSLDVTRRLASVDIEFDGSELPGLTRTTVEAIVATVVAAECAGGAEWCVETAAEYARDREQFGRPIGQFQGVKHRCADMLIATEQARAVAWDAAQADGGLAAAGWPAPSRSRRTPTRRRTASRSSVASASRGSTTPTCTCERAMAMRQLLGGHGARRRARRDRGARRRTPAPGRRGRPRPARRSEPRCGPPPSGSARCRRSSAGAAGRRRLLRASLAGAVGARCGCGRAACDRRGAGAGPGFGVPHLGIGAWAAPTIVVHGTDRAARAVGAPDAATARCVVPAVQRARRRFGPRGADDEGGTVRRRMEDTGPEGLDDDRPRVGLGDLPGPHEPDRAQAPRHHLLHRRHEDATASTSGRCAR